MEHDAARDTLRAIIDCSPLAIITLSPEGNVQSWNPAAERMFGWSEAEALHRPFPSVQAEDAEKYREILCKTWAAITCRTSSCARVDATAPRSS
jgi:PAS domain S-box-containing protein